MKILTILFSLMALLVLFFGPDASYFVIQRAGLFIIFSFWAAGSFFYIAKSYKGGVASVIGMVCLGISIYGAMYALFLMNYSKVEEVIANILAVLVFLIPGILFMRKGHIRHNRLTSSVSEKKSENQSKNINVEQVGTDVPPVTGIYWLKRNSKTERFLRFMLPMFIAAIILFIGTFWVNIYFLDSINSDTSAKIEAPAGKSLQNNIMVANTELKEAFILFTIFVIGLLPVLWLGVNAMRRKLGTDGIHIYIRHPNGKEVSVTPKDVIFNNYTIVYKNILTQIQTGYRQPIYAENELETYILPLLKQAKKMGVISMLWHHITHREPVTIYSIILLGIVAVLLFI